MISAVVALAAPAVLLVPKDMPLPDPDEFKSAEEVVWDGKEGKYTVYTDSIFAVTENRIKFRHVVVRIEFKSGTLTSSNLIDCKKKSWRDVWSTQTGANAETYVSRRDYSLRNSGPPADSPMGAVIARVCRKP